MTESPPQRLTIEALSSEVFAPFGEVIASDCANQQFAINEGTAQRFHALARVECDAGGGYPMISLVRAQPRPMPFLIRMLERHPLGSQAFIPQSQQPYLIVVAESAKHVPRAFLASAGAGVNFRRGTWHHPLLALDDCSDFVVVDRGGDGDNCEEVMLPRTYLLDPGSVD